MASNLKAMASTLISNDGPYCAGLKKIGKETSLTRWKSREIDQSTRLFDAFGPNPLWLFWNRLENKQLAKSDLVLATEGQTRCPQKALDE